MTTSSMPGLSNVRLRGHSPPGGLPARREGLRQLNGLREGMAWQAV